MLGTADSRGIRTFQGPVVWVGLFVFFIFIMAAGYSLLAAMDAYLASLDRIAARSPDRAIAQAGYSLRILAVVVGALTVGTALYTFRSSRLVARHRQMPPPGAWVLGKPKVVVGARAVVMARVGYVLAALLVACGVAVAVMMWHFVDLMMSGVRPDGPLGG